MHKTCSTCKWCGISPSILDAACVRSPFLPGINSRSVFSIAYILVDVLSMHLSCLSNLSLEVKNDDVINDTQAVIGCLRFIGLMANLK